MHRLFLLEDDPLLGEAIRLALEVENFKLTRHSTVAAASAAVESAPLDSYDLFLLDINLPDGTGLEFCQSLRSKGINAPVLFLTVRNDEDSIVTAFNLGADDYIKKPFGSRELLARIKYHLSFFQNKEQILCFKNTVLSITKQELQYQRSALHLNRREFQILKAFFMAPGAVLTREVLMSHISPTSEILDRTIDTHISHLRAKLKKENFPEIRITSVYGTGYKMGGDD